MPAFEVRTSWVESNSEEWDKMLDDPDVIMLQVDDPYDPRRWALGFG
jgi:hypothetical protein